MVKGFCTHGQAADLVARIPPGDSIVGLIPLVLKLDCYSPSFALPVRSTVTILQSPHPPVFDTPVEYGIGPKTPGI